MIRQLITRTLRQSSISLLLPVQLVERLAGSGTDLQGVTMRFGRRPLPILVALVIVLTAVPALAVPLTMVSQDPYTNAASQHQTEVEPDTFSFGSTIISAFQVGRVFGGGSANIGWATSTNNGATWTNGFLPGTTTVVTPTAPFSAISDPAVAYDRRHNAWLISSLGIRPNGTNQV